MHRRHDLLHKSPLQLLAQTCSQIGVDNGPSKILSSSSGADKLKTDDKSKKIDIVSPEPDKVSFNQDFFNRSYTPNVLRRGEGRLARRQKPGVQIQD